MGKHFDAMCHFLEHTKSHESIDRFRPMLRYVSLVEYPKSTPPEFYTDESLSLFRLPWKAVAIEDPISCVVIERCGYSNIIVGHSDESNRATTDEDDYESIRSPRNDARVSTRDVGLLMGDCFNFAITVNGEVRGKPLAMFGRFAFGGRNTGTTVDGRYLEDGLWTKIIFDVAPITNDPKKWDRYSPPVHSDVREVSAQHIMTALWQCVVMTRPSKWILRHDVKPSHKEPKKIPRSHQRPHWIVISDAERARAFRDPTDRVPVTDEKRHVTAHPRRAHYRKIGTNDDGTAKLTWVRSCWVGSIEAEIRGSRYRVELDI